MLELKFRCRLFVYLDVKNGLKITIELGYDFLPCVKSDLLSRFDFISLKHLADIRARELGRTSGVFRTISTCNVSFVSLVDRRHILIDVSVTILTDFDWGQ